MANPVADGVTISGIVFCLFALGTPAAPVAALGIPALLVARTVRAGIDKEQEEKERKAKKEARRERRSKMMNYPVPSGLSALGYPDLISGSREENALAIIAEELPGTAGRTILKKKLMEIHKETVKETAAIFAQQGRGIRARTTLTKPCTFFGDSEIITTEIAPF